MLNIYPFQDSRSPALLNIAFQISCRKSRLYSGYTLALLHVSSRFKATRRWLRNCVTHIATGHRTAPAMTQGWLNTMTFIGETILECQTSAMAAMISYDQLMLQTDHPLQYAILFTIIPEFILSLMVGGHRGYWKMSSTCFWCVQLESPISFCPKNWLWLWQISGPRPLQPLVHPSNIVGWDSSISWARLLSFCAGVGESQQNVKHRGNCVNVIKNNEAG